MPRKDSADSCRMAVATSTEVLTTNAWLARVHPHDRATTVEMIARARDSRGNYIHEFRSIHPDGHIVWCSARGRFFYDPQGKPIRMIGVMQDVTKAKLAAERQEQLLAHYSALKGM